MGLFDSVVGAVTGQVQQQGGMTNVLGRLLADNGEMGGLGGLAEKFKQGGMGEQINSWIGNGENLPISAEQISQILGSDTVRNIASQLGIDPDQAAQQLSAMLPGLIDKLTPNGQAPAGGLGNPGDLSRMLGGILGR
ncbi:YidB family protein [Rhodoferax sp. PAMC 29310]|uniref:YidB family protein n=1 Tax=Rhodoferax sp. PAMC 29310 TaxID=2822760 RepID=UPI001B328DCB|nr:YidB family protein [Rhodoferax sp. PAMC 29310]